jgi:hypothetical protein
MVKGVFILTYILPQYCPMLSHSPILLFYHLGHTLYIKHFYHILTDYIFCCHRVILTQSCFIIHNVLYAPILLPVIYFRYTTYSTCNSSNSDVYKRLPDDGRPLPKHVGACILNIGVVKFSA